MEIEKVIRILTVFLVVAAFAVKVATHLMFPQSPHGFNLPIAIGRLNPCGDWGNIRCVATFTAKAATTRKTVRMRMTFSISIVGVFLFLRVQSYYKKVKCGKI